jgi:hypothetical protein
MENKIVLVRTQSAGVHFGELTAHYSTEVTLKNSQRVWYWSGAASLSQFAMEGVKNPDSCKITMRVDEIYLPGVIEIIPMSEKAITNLSKVKQWKM